MSAATGTAAHALTTGDVEARVRDAMAHRATLRIRGRGHWLAAGRPVRGASVLSLEGLTGIIEYTPGDLTLTARAGTTLEEVERVTAAERQWLALDPPGAPTGTLGALIATASAGPLAHALGTPRDNVLGLEAVTGDAQVIRSGGRVVKNVAGFDITRLLTGSWGTLGVITEVTVRLRALPEVDESWALTVDEEIAPLRPLLTRLRSAAVAPIALELVSRALADHLRVGDRAVLLVRLAGNEESVRAQRAVLATLGELHQAPTGVWRALRECEPADAVVARLSLAASRTAESWAFACAAVAASTECALLHSSVGRGIVRCILPSLDAGGAANFLAATSRFHGTTIFERLPAASWGSVSAGATRDRLSRDVKRAYDPMGILNPGILGSEP